MKLLIRQGRVIDPASGTDRVADVAIAAGRIIGIGALPADFVPNRVLQASGCWVLPGLVDLSVRLREPGGEHAGLLETETAAAVAGGVTSLVCPPDTDPVLDEPGLVDMLRTRAAALHRCRVFPLGALTRGLDGEVLAEMVHLHERGCVGFGQADRALVNTQVLLRAFQYAATFGYTLWLRPQEPWLAKGVMASGPVATRLGLPGVPAAAEVIGLHTLLELLRSVVGSARPAPLHLHVCRLSTAAGVQLVRQAKAEGLPVTADVSVHNLMLTDTDIGYYDTRLRLQPPVRQQRDRTALRQGLADGTIDALVSDHTPVSADDKLLPFGEAAPGATAVELLAGLALKWAEQDGVPLMRALEVITAAPARVLGARLGTLQASVGRLAVGGVADLCVLDPAAPWRVEPAALASQSRHTPFEGHELPARVRATLVGGHVAYEAHA
ncbi:MAG: dihydroorotase [Tepidimonas sp.]|uniref:dihydroorotase n=1 Tax=Tepidimonas sp. TaxID=2002775 RepID=UPI00298F2DF7|nr:dihydroorotase [Tepidimonas sp.]MCS6811249.1 dihydroorotase [Tepidimonas sp.]MDW8336555.1 dihydroorotase [Tepidimonas sp.]